MNEAKGICKNLSRWRSVVFYLPPWEKDVSVCSYVYVVKFSFLLQNNVVNNETVLLLKKMLEWPKGLSFHTYDKDK